MQQRSPLLWLYRDPVRPIEIGLVVATLGRAAALAAHPEIMDNPAYDAFPWSPSTWVALLAATALIGLVGILGGVGRWRHPLRFAALLAQGGAWAGIVIGFAAHDPLAPGALYNLGYVLLCGFAAVRVAMERWR